MAKGDGRKSRRLSKAEARKQRRAKKEAKRKQPSTAVDAPGEKRPIPGPPVVEDPEARIMFRLGLMDYGGAWSFAGLSEEDVKLIATRCKAFESLKLGEFLGLPGTKPIPWESMIQAARERSNEIELDHFDGLWELRLGSEGRLWGLLDGHCFYVVWWDPDHQICPSPKKHT
jgi:hypothetical protein